jgi:hypothetical protein
MLILSRPRSKAFPPAHIHAELQNAQGSCTLYWSDSYKQGKNFTFVFFSS